MIFPSSMTVYPSDVGFAREEDAVSAGPGYATGKLEAESRLLQQSGTDVVILRLPGLFGPPRQSGVLFNAALAFARDKDFRLAEPVPQWSALHVDDAADSVVKATTLPSGKYLVNVGYPGRMSIPDAVGRLALLFGRNWSCSSSFTWFEFDLTRFQQLLGRVKSDFQTRLAQVAQWAQLIASGS
jgi:nucleoside-diphosphate-sugar epimerase